MSFVLWFINFIVLPIINYLYKVYNINNRVYLKYVPVHMCEVMCDLSDSESDDYILFRKNKLNVSETETEDDTSEDSETDSETDAEKETNEESETETETEAEKETMETPTDSDTEDEETNTGVLKSELKNQYKKNDKILFDESLN